MKLTFESIEEVKLFVSQLPPHEPERGTCRPGSIHPQELARLLASVGTGNRIAALRVFRAVTGASLKVALDTVNFHWAVVKDLST